MDEKNDLNNLCKSIVYLASSYMLFTMSAYDDMEEEQRELLEHLHKLAKELNR